MRIQDVFLLSPHISFHGMDIQVRQTNTSPMLTDTSSLLTSMRSRWKHMQAVRPNTEALQTDIK